MKINIWTPHPDDGTSYYRAWGVFNEIIRTEKLPISVSMTNQALWSLLSSYDFIYMHRPFDDSHLRYMQIASNYTKLWVDWDDDLINVPAHNPTHGSYNGKTRIPEILNTASVVTTSTQGLMNNYNADGVVIENYVPFVNKSVYLTPKKDETNMFRIFWRGSNTHEMDWHKHLRSFIQFLRDKKDVVFVCMGDMPHSFKQEINAFCGVRSIKGADTTTYFNHLKTKQLGDVVFVPLVENMFNRAKSDCAAREGLLNGMTAITPAWNSDIGYSYTDDCLPALEQAYKEWKGNYKRFREKVVGEQQRAVEHKKENYTKRLDIIKMLLNLQ